MPQHKPSEKRQRSKARKPEREAIVQRRRHTGAAVRKYKAHSGPLTAYEYNLVTQSGLFGNYMSVQAWRGGKTGLVQQHNVSG